MKEVKIASHSKQHEINQHECNKLEGIFGASNYLEDSHNLTTKSP